MFYVKHKGERITIDYDNVFTVCPLCGREFNICLPDIFEGGEGDLFGTAVYCKRCSIQRINAVQNSIEKNNIP